MANIDKAARLAAEAEAKAAAQVDKAKALNPPFPYRIVAFDPRFFRLR